MYRKIFYITSMRLGKSTRSQTYNTKHEIKTRNTNDHSKNLYSCFALRFLSPFLPNNSKIWIDLSEYIYRYRETYQLINWPVPRFERTISFNSFNGPADGSRTGKTSKWQRRNQFELNVRAEMSIGIGRWMKVEIELVRDHVSSSWRTTTVWLA